MVLCACPYVVSQTSDAEKIIQEVGVKYVPDRRVSIYDVEALSEGATFVLKGKISDHRVYKNLVDTLKKVFPSFIDSVQFLPSVAIGERCWSFVSLSVIYIYKKPSYSSEMVTQALMGTPVKLLDKVRGGWSQIQTPDGYIGWTDTYLQKITVEERKRYNAKSKAIVTARNTLVYENRYKNSSVVADVLMGNILLLDGKYEKEQYYCAVTLPDGRKGYVLSREIVPLNQWKSLVRLTGDDLVNLAKEFVGLPYFWGGVSPNGVDCSGLCKMTYFMHGIILPRDASQQYLCGVEVDTSQGLEKLQKGDLLFFGKPKIEDSGQIAVSHVGMYLGNNKFIHSSNTVHISSFDPRSTDYDQYNHKRFVGAKRIVGNKNGFWSVFDFEWYK
ncbi:MAG: C40 family peptidase [Paludibacteraceae bacterium]